MPATRQERYVFVVDYFTYNNKYWPGSVATEAILQVGKTGGTEKRIIS